MLSLKENFVSSNVEVSVARSTVHLGQGLVLKSLWFGDSLITMHSFPLKFILISIHEIPSTASE